MGQPVDARKKGDIYWRKLKRYIAAEESRGIVPDVERAIAKELFKYYSQGGEIPLVGMRITGNEFKPIPPTSAARELRKREILNLIQKKEELLQGNEKEQAIGHITEKALKAFFNSAGINDRTGEALSQNEKVVASEESIKIYDEFEKAVRHLRRDYAIEYIKGLKYEKSDKAVPFEDEIKELVKGVDVSGEREELIKKVHAEYLALSKKEAELNADLNSIKEAVSKAPDTIVHKYGMRALEAYDEYEAYIREESRALSFAKRCCVAFVKGISTEELINPLYVAYIKEHWKVEVPSFPLDDPVSYLPGYTFLRGVKSEPVNYDFVTFEDFKRGGKELEEYRLSHRSQFEDQTVMSILFGIEEIPDILSKARDLRNKMSVFYRSDDFGKLNEPEKEEFVEIMVSAGAMARIATFIMSYSYESESKTFRELLEGYAEHVYEMDYSRQLRISRSYERRK